MSGRVKKHKSSEEKVMTEKPELRLWCFACDKYVKSEVQGHRNHLIIYKPEDVARWSRALAKKLMDTYYSQEKCARIYRELDGVKP